MDQNISDILLERKKNNFATISHMVAAFEVYHVMEKNYFSDVTEKLQKVKIHQVSTQHCVLYLSWCHQPKHKWELTIFSFDF